MRATLCLAIIGSLASSAHAEPGGLSWQAPASCPDAADVRARIERRLGTPMRDADGAAVDVTASAQGFVAHIAVAGEQRELTSPRCDELADAVAVVIARLASTAPPVEHAPDAPIALATDDSAELDTWGGGIRMVGLSGIGAVPRVGLGGEIAGYVRYQHWFVELAETRWLHNSESPMPQAAGHIEIGMRATALRVGWAPKLPLRAWVGGELGMLEAYGVEFGDNQANTGTWVSVTAGMSVAWEIWPRARVVGILELAVPIERDSVTLQNGGEIYRPDALGARCGVGLELGWR